MKKILVTAILTLIPFFSQARDTWYERGDGGFAAVCKDGVRTYELKEAPARYNYTLDLGQASSVDERVEYLISKVEKYNPQRASLYRGWYKTFFQEAEMLPYTFQPIDDMGLAIKFPDCTIELVVFQRAPKNSKEARYHISSVWWDQLSAYDKGALVMHELIYRELSLPPSPQTDSETPRKFNGWLNSVNSNNVSVQEYLTFLQENFITRAEYKGIPILLSGKDDVTEEWATYPLEFYTNGEAHRVTLDNGSARGFVGRDFILGTAGEPCVYEGKLQTFGVLNFYPDGMIQQITRMNREGSLQACVATYIPPSGRGFYRANSWNFDQNGRLYEFNFTAMGNLNTYLDIMDISGWHLRVVPPGIGNVTFLVGADYGLQSLKLFGNVCYDSPHRTIQLGDKPSLAPAQSLNFQNMEQEVAKLPPCASSILQ